MLTGRRFKKYGSRFKIMNTRKAIKSKNSYEGSKPLSVMTMTL